MDQINQIKRIREEYILKELNKTAGIFTVTNWAVIGSIVLYAASAVFRMVHGAGLPKMSYKLAYQLIWIAWLCFFVREHETRYKNAAMETERAMNDPSFREYSESTRGVRKNTIKSLANMKVIAISWGGAGVFFAALAVLMFYLSWTWNDPPTPAQMLFYVGLLAGGALLIAYGVSEWKIAPESKRLFGDYPVIISQCDSGCFKASAGDDGLSLISCPELGFRTMANPAYPRKYKEKGTFFIYLEDEGYVPYVSIWWSFELTPDSDLHTYLSETFTPRMREEWGDRMHGIVEYATYEIGGKKLPAVFYLFDNANDVTLGMLRLYDIIGDRVLIYEAKYVQGKGEETMNALDQAIRYFQEDREKQV